MDARAGREKVGSVQRTRINQSERLAIESIEAGKRGQMQDRRAAESAGERKARLMRINQSERLTAES